MQCAVFIVVVEMSLALLAIDRCLELLHMHALIIELLSGWKETWKFRWNKKIANTSSNKKIKWSPRVDISQSGFLKKVGYEKDI